MCFLVRVSASIPVPAPPKTGHIQRGYWLRCFVLLLTLLGLFAQQRVLTPALRPSAAVVRQISVRAQSVETHAVRAEPAQRVAAAPVFARGPWFPELFVAAPRAHVHAALAPPPADPSRASLSHFHSKRRIPRMNSEEPPRA